MKFLADENIAVSVVHSLRKAGFDVEDVKEENLCGVSDHHLLKLAYDEDRIILTHDKDFGALGQRQRHHGIVLLRFKNQKPDIVSAILLHALQTKHADIFEHNFVIISETLITVHWKETKKVGKPF